MMWRPLRLTSQAEESFCLLVKYEFSATSYTIQLTDLTYLWTECLDRKQIIRRALGLNTSIDPSEDGNQMRVFLHHVQTCFEGGSGTSISIDGKNSPSRFSLHLSVELPSPLAPLEWPVNLSQSSQNLFTSCFVIPCLTQISSLGAQVDSLLMHLREKDNVIRRLTERMQTDGTDLHKVFPGAAAWKSGSKLGVRDALSKSVKGIAEFDEVEWRKHCAANGDTLTNIYDLTHKLSHIERCGAQPFSQKWDSRNDRWKQLHQGAHQINNCHHKTPPQHQLPQASPRYEAKSSIDDFQVRLLLDKPGWFIILIFLAEANYSITEV